MTQYQISKILFKKAYKEYHIKLNRADAMIVADAIFDIMRESLLSGEKVVLPNLFTLLPHTTESHSHYDINTKTVRIVPGKKKIRCKISQNFSEELNSMSRLSR